MPNALLQKIVQSLAVIFLAAFFFLGSACSVYKSAGRKSFEDRAGSATKPSAQSDLTPQRPPTTASCWTQNRQEPVSNRFDETLIQEQKELSLRLLNDSTMEVCFE